MFDLAEPIPGPTTEALGAVAKARKVIIVASIFERRAAGVYHNTAAVIDEAGKIVGRYRKMHIPDDPRYYEKFYFTPGDLDFVAHPTSRGSIGALVCWDQWFPEAARLTAMAGAQILFYPTAIGWWHGEPEKVRPKQVNAWETIQRSHAIANGVFVAAVNRVGVEGELEFWGNSFVADPFGEVIARASATAEETLVVECDLAKIERGPPQLALPARSPNRRLHRPDAPLSFVDVTAIPPEHRRFACGLPDARRVGAASRVLPRVAAQPRHLARQVRGHPADLRRDGREDRALRAGPPRWSPTHRRSTKCAR